MKIPALSTRFIVVALMREASMTHTVPSGSPTGPVCRVTACFKVQHGGKWNNVDVQPDAAHLTGAHSARNWRTGWKWEIDVDLHEGKKCFTFCCSCCRPNERRSNEHDLRSIVVIVIIFCVRESERQMVMSLVKLLILTDTLGFNVTKLSYNPYPYPNSNYISLKQSHTNLSSIRHLLSRTLQWVLKSSKSFMHFLSCWHTLNAWLQVGKASTG